MDCCCGDLVQIPLPIEAAGLAPEPASSPARGAFQGLPEPWNRACRVWPGAPPSVLSAAISSCNIPSLSQEAGLTRMWLGAWHSRLCCATSDDPFPSGVIYNTRST